MTFSYTKIKISLFHKRKNRCDETPIQFYCVFHTYVRSLPKQTFRATAQKTKNCRQNDTISLPKSEGGYSHNCPPPQIYISEAAAPPCTAIHRIVPAVFNSITSELQDSSPLKSACELRSPTKPNFDTICVYAMIMLHSISFPIFKSEFFVLPSFPNASHPTACHSRGA